MQNNIPPFLSPGLELVKVRSEAMQSASELLPGGMATIMYGANSRVALCCDTAR